MEIRLLLLLFTICLIFCLTVSGESQAKETEGDLKNEEPMLTAPLYAKLFKERRREHHFMAKQMLKSTYEKNFKLLELAYPKIFEVIVVNNETFNRYDYKPAKDGFPQTDAHLQYAVTLTLENCCIAAESLLHFPELSYRIFRKANFASWKTDLNWCIGFVNALPHLIEESTVKLMELLQQEINEELRAKTYTNPYYTKRKNSEVEEPEMETAAKRKKKPPKKLKKGPQLSGSRNEL